VTYSGIIANFATGTTITKTGVGKQTLSGANTYTGATSVNAGTLDLGGGTANGSLASTILNLGGGAFNYTRTGSTTQSFTTTNINSSVSSISVAAGNTLNLGTVVRGTGGAFNFDGTTGAGTVAALTASNTNGIMSGFTFGDTWAVANGAGVAISGLGAFTQSSAALDTAGNYTDNNIDVDSSQTPDAAITPNSLRFSTAAANTMTLQGANTAVSGILVGSGVGNNLSTITGGTLTGAASGNLSITQNNTANELVIGSDIPDNTLTSLTKSGLGILTLSGTNTYTGNTTITAGTLKLSGASTPGLAGGSGSTVIVDSGALLDLNGTNQNFIGWRHCE
jgi:fibronectin-binding autotransporter adhesin